MSLFSPSISKEEVNALDIQKFEGAVYVVEDQTSFEEHWHLFSNEKIVGIDTESKPSFQKGKSNKVSLLQISTSEHAMLIRLNKMNLPEALIAFLEDKSVLKIGAALHDDIKDLKKITQFEPAGFLDLQKYVGAFRIEELGLQKMVAIVLGFKISKSQQTSNWENDPLSEAQIAYASTDAWAPLLVYIKLQESLK